MNVLGKRIGHLRLALDLSQTELGNKVGMTQQGINSIEKGDSKRPKKLREIAVILKTSQEYLLGEVESPVIISHNSIAGLETSGVRTIPVVDYVQAGEMSEIADPYPVGAGHNTITIYKADDIGPHAFALEVEGESMIVNPPVIGAVSYLPGEVIVCDPDAPVKPGDLVIAKSQDGEEATFKKYRPRGSDAEGNEIYDLVPLNEDYETIQITDPNKSYIVGKVVRHTRTP